MKGSRPLRVRWTVGLVGIICLYGMLGIQSSYAWNYSPREGILVYPKIDAVGYLTAKPPQGIGRVVGTSAEKSVLIGENELVYLDVGTRNGIQEGDLLLAFSLQQPREIQGLQLVIIEGRLRVQEVNQSESAAIVEEAYRSLALGSRVDIYRPLDPQIHLQSAPEYLEGTVFWNYLGLVSYGLGDLVFMDMGTVDGVQPGQCYEVYRVPTEEGPAAAVGRKGKYGKQAAPALEHLTLVVGEVVVLRVQDTTSVALVTRSKLPLVLGERVRAGCEWQRQVAKKALEAPVVPKPPPPPAAPPRAEAEEEALRAAREAFENVDIHFAFDSYGLSEEAKRVLQEKAGFLRGQPDIQVLIEGHCDERGTEQYNLALGDRRANAARQYLMGLGILEQRMSTVSYGEERPLDPGHNEEAWTRNRRAHFVIQSP